eukprot:4108388-Prymnesium_polylepis.1
MHAAETGRCTSRKPAQKVPSLTRRSHPFRGDHLAIPLSREALLRVRTPVQAVRRQRSGTSVVGQTIEAGAPSCI